MTPPIREPEGIGNGWSPCSSREFQNLARLLRGRQRRRLLVRAALGLGGTSALVALAISSRSGPKPMRESELPVVDAGPPLNCRQFRELVVLFQRGHLSGAERPRMDEHREHCPPCQRLWESTTAPA